jgi:hypothetical protein
MNGDGDISVETRLLIATLEYYKLAATRATAKLLGDKCTYLSTPKHLGAGSLNDFYGLKQF